MPIYEYSCSSCGADFEKILKAGSPNPPCPTCDAATDKKISLSSFQLKGGGWYSDAYAGADNKSPAAKSAGSESSSPKSKTEPKSDSSSSTSASTPKADAAPSKPASTSKPSPSSD